MAGGLIVSPPGASFAQNATESEEPKPMVTWTDADTKLANHYFRLLEQKPEYGNVLDLLWGLYEKKSQTDLLVEYLKNASTQQGTIVARTLFGHLLRKNEQLDEAREVYSAILDDDPENVIALRGAAEISDQQGRSAKALALYTRLVERTPITTEDGVAFRLRQAAMLRAGDQLEEAAKLWNELLTAWPNDNRLRSEIVSLLIEAGRTEDAIAALEELTKTDDPELRLTSLDSLARLHEFIGDYDAASTAIQEAMSLLHFKHHEFAALFERLVRLHERFDRLPELENLLETDASRENPSERAVFLIANFYRLTANPVKEETWAERLTQLAPSNVDYQLRLVDTRMQNDHYAAAAETLDALIASQNEAPLALTLLRSRVALNLEGRDRAEEVIDAFLARWPNADVDTLGTILAFAREHYLDGLVERLLGSENGKMLAGGERESAPSELARFFHERGRTKQAEDTLLDYVAEAEGSPTLKAARLAEVTAVFREMDLTRAAVTAIEEAIALAPENIDYRTTRAEIHIDRKETDLAIAAFEKIWDELPDLKSRSEIDQRIFSLLRGLTDDSSGASNSSGNATPTTGRPRTIEQYRRMAAAVNRSVRAADDPPPQRLVDYYGGIKEKAKETPSVATRYRAAWWAFKLQDTQEASHQLNTAREEAGDTPVVEIEKLQLDLAELYQQYPLIARQLKTLMEIDPDNAKDYQQRWAETRFELGYEDEGIRALEELAQDPDVSLNTLKTLASLYQRQGRTKAQVEVWQEAYRRGNLFEKRRIIKQLSTTLIELGRHEDALKSQMDLIQRETDPIQQRKQFDSQLSVATRHFLVEWLVNRYRELAQQNPFDRFYPEALARTLQAKGDYDAAFAAMKRAYYMSGQDRDLLAELGELAGLTKDLKAAIYYRRQMIALNEDDASPETWQSLVKMMERDLRVGEADQIRERLESKFTQDADFLVQLAREYRETGRYSAAERVLQRLTSLRPWDSASWLAYGLVLKQRGLSTEALQAFERAIEETHESQVELKPGNRLAYWPVVASKDGAAVTLGGDAEDASPLAAMLRAMSDYPFIDDEVQESILNWLEKPNAVFDYAPTKAEPVRLRAIEEAAKLHARSPENRAAWVQRWLSEEAEAGTTIEKLWALRYAGAGDEAFSLMQDSLEPLQSPLERFLFSVVALRLGKAQELIEWADAEDESAHLGPETERRVYPLLGMFAILRQPESHSADGDDPITRQIPIVTESISLTAPVVSFLFETIRDEGRDAEAYAFGSAMVNQAQQPNPELMLDLAQVAGALGLEAEKRDWLKRCVDALEPRFYVGLPYYYFQAVSELYHQLESADERLALVSELRDRFDLHPGASEEVKLENRTLLSLITGDGDTAADSMRTLVQLHLAEGRPDRQNVEGESYTRVQGWGWSRVERILHAFAARRPDRVNPRPFFSALEPAVAADPRNLEAVSDYEQYEVERVCWKLETLSPAERRTEVALLSSRLRDPNSRLQFARTLEARGLQREAIPIYRQVVEETPEEISPARGFFSACLKAQEFRPAIELLDAYLLGEMRVPSGMAPDDLYRQHADFLLMAGEIESLTARSIGPGDPGPASGNTPASGLGFNSPGGLDRTVFYQNALVRAHQRRGNDEATLRVLNHLRDQGRLTEDDRLLAGEIAAKLGDEALAMDWWKSIQLDQQQPMAEGTAIRELARIHATADPPDRSALGDLARATEDYDNTDLTLDTAARLFEAGMPTEGRGLLLLATREKMIDSTDRIRLMSAIVRLRLEHGASFSEVAGDLDTLLENQVAAIDPLRDWLQIVVAHGRSDDAETEQWIAALEPWKSVSRTRLAAELASAWLEGTLSSEWSSADLALSTSEIDLAIEVLPELGESGIEVARAWLAQRPGSSATICEGNVDRQVVLFGKLGDRIRAAEVSSRLLLESETDGFQQFSVRRRSNSAFAERWPLPARFAEAGFPDLARALFAHYHRSIRRLTWEHQEFIDQYARFLIDHGRFAEAETVLIPAFQKSIGAEPQLLVSLYRAWGKLDEMPARMQRFDLTSGVQVRLDELRTVGETGELPQ